MMFVLSIVRQDLFRVVNSKTGPIYPSGASAFIPVICAVLVAQSLVFCVFLVDH